MGNCTSRRSPTRAAADRGHGAYLDRNLLLLGIGVELGGDAGDHARQVELPPSRADSARSRPAPTPARYRSGAGRRRDARPIRSRPSRTLGDKPASGSRSSRRMCSCIAVIGVFSSCVMMRRKIRSDLVGVLGGAARVLEIIDGARQLALVARDRAGQPHQIRVALAHGFAEQVARALGRDQVAHACAQLRREERLVHELLRAVLEQAHRGVRITALGQRQHRRLLAARASARARRRAPRRLQEDAVGDNQVGLESARARSNRLGAREGAGSVACSGSSDSTITRCSERLASSSNTSGRQSPAACACGRASSASVRSSRAAVSAASAATLEARAAARVHELNAARRAPRHAQLERRAGTRERIEHERAAVQRDQVARHAEVATDARLAAPGRDRSCARDRRSPRRVRAKCWDRVSHTRSRTGRGSGSESERSDAAARRACA